MAEFGAHLTSTDDGDKPSIFEVLAQENLMTALRPALKHACRVLVETNPQRYEWLYRFSDEIYTFFELILQSYCLNKHAASFAENFYDLKRQALHSQTNGRILPKSIQNKSLLFLVLVPYLKHKLDQLFEHLRDKQAAGLSSSQPVLKACTCLFLRLYPHINLVWESTIFAYQLLYSVGYSAYHTPFLPFAGVKLINKTEEDWTSQSASGHRVSLSDVRSWRSWLIMLLKRGLGLLAVSLSSALSVAVFFLQFLEWWYSSGHSTTAATSMPIPAPPKKSSDNVPKMSSICPLCHRIRTNDTALATSGYVFCYPCIYNYVQQKASCPVTGFATNLGQLIKIYQIENT